MAGLPELHDRACASCSFSFLWYHSYRDLLSGCFLLETNFYCFCWAHSGTSSPRSWFCVSLIRRTFSPCFIHHPGMLSLYVGQALPRDWNCTFSLLRFLNVFFPYFLPTFAFILLHIASAYFLSTPNNSPLFLYRVELGLLFVRFYSFVRPPGRGPLLSLLHPPTSTQEYNHYILAIVRSGGRSLLYLLASTSGPPWVPPFNILSMRMRISTRRWLRSYT
jgi:hypothetical protein